MATAKINESAIEEARKALDRAKEEQERISKVITESQSVSGAAIRVLRRAGYLRDRKA